MRDAILCGLLSLLKKVAKKIHNIADLECLNIIMYTLKGIK